MQELLQQALDVVMARLGPEHRTSRARESIKKHAFKAD